MRSTIGLIQSWYAKQCNGEWEHQYGIKIDTLDNPGWSVEIDLAGTSLADLEISDAQEVRSDDDWLSYSVSDGKFRGFGGPESLEGIIEKFLLLAKNGAKE